MAAQYYKINYKSDFVLTINSDAGWAVPFCIKFWTGMPLHGYFAGFDGENYVNCRVGETPTQLLVMFDDHHMPIGPLRMQIAYHTTIEEFPDRKFDEVTNPTNVTVDIDGTEYQVMLDFTGETGAEIDFSMPSSGVMSVNGKIGYVTLNAEDVGAQPTIEDLATIRSGAAAGATAVQPAAITPIENDIDAIEGKIPSAASASNQLADKAFVNSALSGKADTSDIPTALSQLSQDSTHRVVTDAEKSTWNGKQNTIDDLATIRSGAAAGATAVQPAAMNTALAAKQDTLTFDNTPTANSNNPVKSGGVKTAIDAKQDTISDLATIRSGAAAGATAYQKPGTGIPSTDLASAVQTSLERADEAAVRPYNTQSPDGMGYLVLDKDATFASQVTTANTIYEIRYDFTLTDNFTMPTNCVLRFNGGTISGAYTLTGTDTMIEAGLVKIFGSDVSFGGSFVGNVNLAWFDATQTGLIKATTLAHITLEQNLNCNGIELNISGSTVFTENQGCNIRNLNIIYTPTANNQAAIVYDQVTAYSGGNYIFVDSVLTCNNTGSYSLLSGIYKKDWSDTTRALYENIRFVNFDAYCFVNSSYDQMTSVVRCAGSGTWGFWSNNHDSIMDGGEGSCNVLRIDKCSLNHHYTVAPQIDYIFDLTKSMSVDIIDFVAQGTYDLSPNASIYFLRHGRHSSALDAKLNIKGLWVEYYNVDNIRRWDLTTYVRVNFESSHNAPIFNLQATDIQLNVNQYGMTSFDVDTQIINSDNYRYDLILDSVLRGAQHFSLSSIKQEYNKGNISRLYLDRSINNGTALVPNISWSNDRIIDIKKYIIENLIVFTADEYRSAKPYIVYQNGFNVLKFTAGDTAATPTFRLNQILPKFYGNQVDAIVDMIYKTTIDVDVTNENISNVKNTSRWEYEFAYTGSNRALITPVVGDTAGTTTGWKRNIQGVRIKNSDENYNSQQNTTFEVASFKFHLGEYHDTFEGIDSDGNLYTNDNSLESFTLNGTNAYGAGNNTLNAYMVRAWKNARCLLQLRDSNNRYLCQNGKIINVGLGTLEPDTSDASAIAVGFQYLNTTTNKVMIWDGSTWKNDGGTSIDVTTISYPTVNTTYFQRTQGGYMKVGRLVFINMRIRAITAIGSSLTGAVTGLPKALNYTKIYLMQTNGTETETRLSIAGNATQANIVGSTTANTEYVWTGWYMTDA